MRTLFAALLIASIGFGLAAVAEAKSKHNTHAAAATDWRSDFWESALRSGN